MTRLTVTTAALAAVALAVPAGAGAAPIDVAIKLEARAVADSARAVSLVRDSAVKASSAVRQSQRQLRRAYVITLAQGSQTSSKGMQAAAAFSASAETQGDHLSTLVERSHGSVKTTTAKALASIGRMEAELISRVAEGLGTQKEATSEHQGAAAASLGDDQAQLTATLALTASSTGVREAAQEQLDKTTAASVRAQARLVQAVAELRQRSEDQGEAGMASAQASLKRSSDEMVAALRRSGRWEVSYAKTVATGDGPVAASATVDAHLVVDGGRR